MIKSNPSSAQSTPSCSGDWASDLGLLTQPGGFRPERLKSDNGVPYYEPAGDEFSVIVPSGSTATKLICYDCDHWGSNNEPGWRITWSGGSMWLDSPDNGWISENVNISGDNIINFDGNGDSHGGNACIEGGSFPTVTPPSATDTPTPSATPNPSTTPTPTPIPTATPSPTPTPTPVIHEPWMATGQGDVFYQDMQQASLSEVNVDNNNKIAHTFLDGSTPTAFEDTEAFLSYYLLLKSEPSSLQYNSSNRDYSLNNYPDANSDYKGSTWFEYLGVRFLSLIPTSQIVNNPQTNFDRISDIPEIPGSLTDEDIILFTSNSLNVDINICDRKAIFLIQGDLIINPDLIADTFEDGCLFLVQGETLVTSGENKSSGTPVERTYYDQLDAYIITDSFTTQEDPNLDGLYIKGSVITNNIELNRELSNTRNEYAPSEYFEYDPRYLYIYDDLLYYRFPFSIGESQFINSIPHE